MAWPGRVNGLNHIIGVAQPANVQIDWPKNVVAFIGTFVHRIIGVYLGPQLMGAAAKDILLIIDSGGSGREIGTL